MEEKAAAIFQQFKINIDPKAPVETLTSAHRQIVETSKAISKDCKILIMDEILRVVIAKTLATDSKVIIFDKPTRGIDVGEKQDIYELMNELAQKGIGIIMISSDMVEKVMPGRLKNVYAPSCGGKYMVVMQFQKSMPSDEGRQRQAALLDFSAFSELKHVILVDEDYQKFILR